MSGKIIVVLQMIQSLIAKRNRFVAHRVKKRFMTRLMFFCARGWCIVHLSRPPN